MRLEDFRIQNYRIIEDTGWINVDTAVTGLVGINESGKSSILTALYKLNPSTPAAYDTLAEFPHDRYPEVSEDHLDIPVASARYSLGVELHTELMACSSVFSNVKKVECTRLYSGNLEIDFIPSIEPESFTNEIINSFIDSIVKGIKNYEADPEVNDENKVYEFRVSRLIDEFQTEIESSFSSDLLIQSLEDFWKQLQEISDEETEFIQQYEPLLEKITSLQEQEATYQQSIEVIKENLPVFILFEDYATLRGSVYLREYNQQKNNKKSVEWVRTADALFKLAKYPIDKISELYDEVLKSANNARNNNNSLTLEQHSRLERITRESHIRSESSGLAITRKFNEWWPLGDYSIKFIPTVDFFEVRVSDARREVSVELDYRSRGFKYFFSFFLVFEAESDGGHRDSILLLDEPGLHLHINAQQQLLKFFDSIAENNQLIYTTHLPFMIDGYRLDRIRGVVQREPEGDTVITDYLSPTKGDGTFFPLEVILGYQRLQALFIGNRSLIVEGWTDYWVLKMIDKLLWDEEGEGLHPDTYVFPTGGTNNIPLTTQMVAGQNTPYLILLDSDKAGNDLQKRMQKNLSAFSEHFVMLGDIVEEKYADLESLFPENYFIQATIETYNVGKFTIDDLELKKKGLGDAIKRYFAKQKYENFDKSKVYLHLVRRWSTQTLEELPEQLIINIKKLFAEVNKRFEEQISTL